MEVGEEEDYYLPIATTVTTGMTPALRRAVTHESQFNVLLIVRDKVTRQCPQTTILK